MTRFTQQHPVTLAWSGLMLAGALAMELIRAVA
jgi:hypothetical protein